MDPNPSPPRPPNWSSIIKQQPPPRRNHHTNGHSAAAAVLARNCNSTKGIAVAVVDANAIIQGGERLHNRADKFASVSEVMEEIRDPRSRHSLNTLPFSVESLEPSTDSLKKVINFARATGDLQTLSDVDLKLIALTYTLEAQIHGTKNLRDSPPPIHTVNVKRLPEKDLPGWGSNVPNLEEWEALEKTSGDGSNTESKILPLKDLNMNVIPIEEHHSVEDGSRGILESQSEGQQDADDGIFNKPRNYFPKKKEVSIEGKKNVADGIDASLGESNDNADDWLPAVSRSTHRRFLRRKARRQMFEASSENYSPKDAAPDVGNENLEDAGCPDLLTVDESYDETRVENEVDESYDETRVENESFEGSKIIEEKTGEGDLNTILNQMRLEDDSLKVLQDVNKSRDSPEEPEFSDSMKAFGNSESISDDAEDITSHASETIDSLFVDDNSSEQSWMLRSLSESTVACITSDFAMQNVLLQMGLRLLAPGGMQIRELHRWILKCHACYHVTAEIGRIFCPKCGNGGTLRKVAVTVGENGIVLAAHRPRISLRGTKFSLPMPQGGRDAITKNPVLREDQLPQKFLYPKTKKKNKEEDIFATNHIFLHHTDKKAPLQPPVRKALSVFSGRRNPNDNHYSRSKH